MQLRPTHKSITVFKQHIMHQHIMHYKIITEEPATVINKLSVVAPCSKIIALSCFIREQRG